MTAPNRRLILGTSLLILGMVVLSLTSADPDRSGAQEATGQIGDRVWLDANNNGRLDSEEVGIAGVLIELHGDANTDGAPDGTTPLQTTTSDTEGWYVFDGVAAGPHALRIPVENWDVGGALHGCLSSAPTTIDADTFVDGDDNGFELPGVGIIAGPVTIGPNRPTDPTIDFGCHRPVFDVAVVLAAAEPTPLFPGDLVEVRVEIRNDGTLNAESLAVGATLSDGLVLADPDWEQLKDGTLLREVAIDVLRPGITATVALQLEAAAPGEQLVTASLASARSVQRMPNGVGFEDVDPPVEPAGFGVIVEGIGSPPAVEEPASESPAEEPESDPVIEAPIAEDEPADEVADSPGPETPEEVDVEVEGAVELPRQAVSPADVVAPAAQVDDTPVLALTGAERDAGVLLSLILMVSGAILLLFENRDRLVRPAQR
jgi:BarA-like signal transduction histidine kinase